MENWYFLGKIIEEMEYKQKIISFIECHKSSYSAYILCTFDYLSSLDFSEICKHPQSSYIKVYRWSMKYLK